MRSQIRNLRQKMALECAESDLRNLCNDLYDEWQAAASTGRGLPEPRQFIQRVFRLGFYLPTLAAAHNHLDRCLQNKEPPHPEDLLHTLLPWTTKL